MLTKKTESDRFSKVLMKLNSVTPDKPDKQEPPRPPSSHNSFLQDLSIRSEKSTKYGSQIESRPLPLMDESRAIRTLMEQPEVLINKQVTRMHTEFVSTSNGMRFILLVGEVVINLSWLHSVQELQPGKVLLLYYDLRGLTSDGKPKLESLVMEAGRTQGSTLLAALALLHTKYHDDEVEKLYHFLC